MKRTMRTASLLLVTLACAAGLAAAQSRSTGGTLTVEVTANGEHAAGTVEVFPAAGGPSTVHGDAGTALPVPPGTYDVQATLTDAIDHPQHRRGGIDVAAAAARTAHIDFQIGRVTLVCRKAGLDVPGAARIRRPGASAWLPEVRCGREFLVSGGTYEGEITPDGAANATRVDLLQIMEGATQRLPVDL
jgi:hypothetical protein